MAEALATPAPRERPILFSGALVRAILGGKKSQTRRLIKPQPDNPEIIGPISPIWGYGVPLPHVDSQRRFGIHAAFNVDGKRVDRWLPCPYGAPGDRLWVRETHAQFAVGNRSGTAPQCVAYRATCEADGGFDYVNNGDEVMRIRVTKWTPAIHMPRWASRITLEVTAVHVERLHDITEDDLIAEGIGVDAFLTENQRRLAFFAKWDELHGAGVASKNQWVWVIGCRKL